MFTDYPGKHFDPPSLSPQTGNAQIDDTPFVFGPWAFLTGHEGPFTNKVNIAKGTTDPRVEFTSQVLTQILTKFHLQNLDQTSTSKS